MLDGQGKMLYVGSKVSHRFHPLYRKVGEVISLEGHMFDGEQMIVVDWGESKKYVYPIQHHFAEALNSEA